MKHPQLFDSISFWMHPEKSTAFYDLLQDIIDHQDLIGISDDVLDLYRSFAKVEEYFKERHPRCKSLLRTMLNLPDVQEYLDACYENSNVDTDYDSEEDSDYVLDSNVDDTDDETTHDRESDDEASDTGSNDQMSRCIIGSALVNPIIPFSLIVLSISNLILSSLVYGKI